MSDQPVNLADKFAPVQSARGERLNGLLNTRRRNSRSPDTSGPKPVGEQPAVDADAAELSRSPENVDEVTGEAAEYVDEVATETVDGQSTLLQTRPPVPAYVTPETRVALKARAAKEGKTFADVAVDAFGALSRDKLTALFQTRYATNSMGMPTLVKPDLVQNGVEVRLQFLDSQVDWIDRQIGPSGAPSRSALIAAVLKAYLLSPR